MADIAVCIVSFPKETADSTVCCQVHGSCGKTLDETRAMGFDVLVRAVRFVPAAHGPGRRNRGGSLLFRVAHMGFAQNLSG